MVVEYRAPLKEALLIPLDLVPDVMMGLEVVGLRPGDAALSPEPGGVLTAGAEEIVLTAGDEASVMAAARKGDAHRSPLEAFVAIASVATLRAAVNAAPTGGCTPLGWVGVGDDSACRCWLWNLRGVTSGDLDGFLLGSTPSCAVTENGIGLICRPSLISTVCRDSA